jgi:dTDP-4-dehydrorhamnose reductase
MKVVLFGSTGMLGRYVHKILDENHQIICITRADFDICSDSWEKLTGIIKNTLNQGDLIINCAGSIPQKYNSDNYKQFIRVNSLFPHKLNDIAKHNNYRFIHVTTDCVFDGKEGNYALEHAHTAKDIYGISKSLGEPDDYATIIRTSIIGEELSGKRSFIEWIKSNRGKTINGFTNHYWNGVTCLTVAKIIKQVINDDCFWKGVRHICSPNAVTKYELCEIVNDAYKLNIEILPREDTVMKNMTLIGNDLYIIDEIQTQIEEQYLTNIIIR